MKTKIVLLFILISFKAISQEKENPAFELNIGYTVEYNMQHKLEFRGVIEALKGFLKTKNSVYKDNPYWIENDIKFYKFPFLDLIDIETFGNRVYKPTLISITQVESHEYIAKVGWFSIDEQMNVDVKVIFNFHVIKTKGKYLIRNILNRNIDNWIEKKYDKITYFYSKGRQIDYKKVEEFNSINRELADFFENEPIEFKYFICESNNELLKIRGFDFEESMFFTNQNGSETFPHDMLIFSGNNSEINKHELVHLYTYLKFKKRNSIIDEGIATFLGGSKGLSYKEHLAKMREHIIINKIDVFQKLFYNSYVLDFDTSLKYTLGAFLCDIALKKYKKEGLNQLLNSGKTNEELISTIETLFDIKKEHFNAFIKSELDSYIF
uniref:hypothetical protein n=2 Tax=Flavobacterium sp. TaxID=239 RepID=UPI00404B7C8F